MSTVKEELHVLVDRLPPASEKRALKIRRHIVDCPSSDHALRCRTENEIQPSSFGELSSFDELMRRRFRQIGHRLGLDVDQLPQNGYCSGGVVGDRVELTKDWESEDARHRLSQIDVQGHDIIVFERMETVDGTELRYEIRVFTDQSEGRAEVNLPIGQSPSQKG
jgi:hypothetical protein